MNSSNHPRRALQEDGNAENSGDPESRHDSNRDGGSFSDASDLPAEPDEVHDYEPEDELPIQVTLGYPSKKKYLFKVITNPDGYELVEKKKSGNGAEKKDRDRLNVLLRNQLVFERQLRPGKHALFSWLFEVLENVKVPDGFIPDSTDVVLGPLGGGLVELNQFYDTSRGILAEKVQIALDEGLPGIEKFKWLEDDNFLKVAYLCSMIAANVRAADRSSMRADRQLEPPK